MPSLLDIRRRIRSVKNTQQLTKAMKTVSAAKLRRAQDRVMSARPYADQLRNVLANLAGRVENISHPLLEIRSEERTLVVVVTADRGLCGAFNTNLIRATQNFLREKGSNSGATLLPVGRKGRDFFRRREVSITSDYVNFFNKLDYGNARDIAKIITQLYTEAKIDAVYIVYNEFKSAIQQRISMEKLLPLGRSDLGGMPRQFFLRRFVHVIASFFSSAIARSSRSPVLPDSGERFRRHLGGRARGGSRA